MDCYHGATIQKSLSYTFIYDTYTQQWIRVNANVSSYRRDLKCVDMGSHIISVGRADQNDEKCSMTAIHIKCILPHWKWIMLNPYFLLRQLIDDNRVDSDMGTDTKANEEISDCISANAICNKNKM